MFRNLTRRRLVATGAAASLAPPAHAAAPTVSILGDSITAGYGLPPGQALPAKLQAELTRLGVAARVRPAGVSGDTTAGGVRRLEQAAAGGAQVCIVALGGNDLLRGEDPRQMEANLETIVRRLKSRGITVVLAGLQVPTLLGGAWAAGFNRAFADVARREQVIFMPDMLAGVALNPELNQPDGIHPNARGVTVIARRLAPLVARALQTA